MITRAEWSRHPRTLTADRDPPPMQQCRNDDFLLARYRADGTLDPRFGVGGLVTTDFFGGPDHARAVIEQPDGSIVVGGSATASQHILSGFGLARYLGDRARGAHDR